MPRATQRFIVSVGSNQQNRDRTSLGDYTITVGTAGTIEVKEGSTGNPISLEDLKSHLAAVVSGSGKSEWSAELKIPLELLAGFARTDKISLLVEGAGGQVLQTWPTGTDKGRPVTWGTLVLESGYDKNIQAGSVFTDGLTGYLCVPFASALAPADMTIEAWARVVDTGGGTIVATPGSGEQQYWFGIRDVLQLRRGTDFIRRGRSKITPGWHHVAVSIDRGGHGAFYLDGEIDQEFSRPQDTRKAPEINPQEPAAPPKLNSAVLRVGSDESTVDGPGGLHGYLRELRIWNRVRSREEIVRSAFQNLSGKEPDLVALWPFIDGMKELVAGNDAGLVGNAALAREAPDVTRFVPQPHVSPAMRATAREAPSPVWDGKIPYVDHGLVIDGIARPSEYGAAAAIPLEPNPAKAGMRMVFGTDGLHFSTSVLPGKPAPANAVTIWINRDGRGGKHPNRSDLRVEFRPDGTVATSEGNGREFVPTRPPGVVAKNAHAMSLRTEDGEIQLPWWSTEACLSAEVLRPFQLGQTLHMAVRYGSSVPPSSLSSSSWPGSFDPAVPDTWGIVQTSTTPLPSDHSVDQRTESGVRHFVADPNGPAGAGILATAAMSSPPDPPTDPTEADFNNNCPTISPGMNPFLLTDADAKWPHVKASSDHFVRAEGYMSDIGLAEEDAVMLHDSHDFDMKINVYPEYQWLVLNSESELRLETESGHFDRRALPTLGDHATVYGRWVFDCGHSPRTEIHPIGVFESDRQQQLALWAGAKAQWVSVARIRVNRHPGAVHNFSSLEGPFEFDIRLPGAPSHSLPFVRAVQGPLNTLQKASFSLSSPNMLHITLPDPDNGYYELIAGFLDAADAWTVNTSQITFSKIDINDDHDAKAFNTTGEWYMLANVNGTWRTIFWNSDVNEDDSPYSLTHIAPITLPKLGDQIQLSVMGYEDDDSWDNPGGVGDAITTKTTDCWSLAIKDGKAKSKPADWSLYFSVKPGGELPTIFEDKQYWEPRLADEASFSFGKIGVPAIKNAPSQVTDHDSFLLLDTSLRNDRTKLLVSDEEDYYDFALDDFAKVTISTTGSIKYAIEHTDPWYYSMPQNLKDLFGYRSATVKVSSASTQTTDQPYKISIKREYRELPPDWGEPMDTKGGRIVDLATPAPKALVTPRDLFHGERRRLQMDWAWQHLAGDVDIYQVLTPKGIGGGPGVVVFACKWNRLARLRLSAPGMRITVPGAGIVKESSVELDHLESFPDHKVEVIVENPVLNGRGAYQFSAEWEGDKIHSVSECGQLDTLMQHLKESLWTVPVMEFPPKQKPDPTIAVREIRFSPLGDYMLINLPSGDTIDMVISGEKGKATSARLYSPSGLLLGESSTLDEGLRANIRGTPGLVAQSRLTVKNLAESSRYYVLQMLPARDVTSVAKERAVIGLSVFSSAQ
jgi:hypothetical protein